MSPRLAEHIACLPPSGIRKFCDIVSEMKDAISLGVGEPDFVTPWAYSDAAIYSMRAGHTHYTSNWGLIELRRAINEYQLSLIHIWHAVQRIFAKRCIVPVPPYFDRLFDSIL